MARKLTLIREVLPDGVLPGEDCKPRAVELYERLADESLQLIRRLDDLDGECDEMLEDLARIERSFDGEGAGDVLPDPNEPIGLSVPAMPELTVIDGGRASARRRFAQQRGGR